MSDADLSYMKKAIALAQRGLNRTRPNPLVGAVIVKNGKIIGQGFHTKCGAPHAEVEAFRDAKRKGNKTKGATIYVTLEPCCHFGNTPPCVNAVIENGIKRVVCSVLDPNPLVAGKGINKLHEQGIEVEVGTLQEEAMQLNEGFLTFHALKRPFVAIKFASSLDGKIATFTGDSKWITNDKSRTFARQLRARYDAILVGKNTVLKDNPHLGCREQRYQDPLRVILDSKLSSPIDAKVFRDSNVIVFAGSTFDKEKYKKLKQKNIEVVASKHKKPKIDDVLHELYQRKIHSIFVEGGSQVLGSFVEAQLVDKVYAFQASLIIGGQTAPGAIGGNGISKISESLQLVGVVRKKLGNDLLTYGYTKQLNSESPYYFLEAA